LPLGQQSLRHTQLLFSARRAVARQPGSPQEHLIAAEAHRFLYETYKGMAFVDLTLEHLERLIESLRLGNPPPQQPPANIPALERERDALRAVVQTLQDKFLLDTQGMPALHKSISALNMKLEEKQQEKLGVPEKQRQKDVVVRLIVESTNALLKADARELAVPEHNRRIYDELVQRFFSTGQLDELRALASQNSRRAPEIEFQVAAAFGDYRAAGEYLDQWLGLMERAVAPQLQRMLFSRPALLYLFNPGPLANVPLLAGEIHGLRLQHEAMTAQLLEIRTLRALLALEQGDTDAAARFFESALHPAAGPPAPFDSRPVAVRYSELLREARKE
jgi:hypothetical protein